MRQAKSCRKGFTLVEVITVVTITVILAAIAIPLIVHFVQRAEQTARNNTARTLFSSAQSALSQSVLGGGALPAADGAVDVTRLANASEEEKQQNAGKLGYLVLGRNEANPAGNTLYSLLAPFVNDPVALSGAILLEYNTETGNALSLFYSDTVNELGYDGAAGKTRYNVFNRGEEALAKGEVGYFGVDSTGEAQPAPARVGEVEVRIADYDGSAEAALLGNDINGGENYGLLCVECTLPESGASSYSLELIQLGTVVDTLRFTSGDVSAISLSAAFTGYTTRTVGGNACKIVRYLYTRADGRSVVVFVLDYAAAGFSIADNYPNVKNGYLAARFTATAGEASSSAVTPNAAHAFFAEERTVAAGGTATYTLTSPRHLNNVRLAADAHFRQTRDISVRDYTRKNGAGGSRLAFLPIESFSGSYTGMPEDTPYRIEGLKVSAGSAGLFAQLAASATVSYVTLENAQIAGTANAGGIAGESLGTVSRCTVLPGSTVTAAGSAGGIVGVHNAAGDAKAISACYAAANVSASGENGSAGGIAGVSAGRIHYCEVGTALAQGSGGAPYLAGTPDYGARAAGATADYSTAGIENDLVSVLASGNNGSAGGLAGRVESGGEVRYSVNAARVEAMGTTASAGGLAGQITNTGDNSAAFQAYNAGSVSGGKNAGGLFGYCNAEIKGCYNTGLVNASALVTAFQSFSDTLYSYASGISGTWVGGIVGYGDETAKVLRCYSAQYVGGSGHGAFGMMKGLVASCSYLKTTHNQKEDYLTSETAAGGEPKTAGLNVCASAALRGLSADGLSAGTLREGAYGRFGVGPYGYTLPFISIDNASCTLGNDFHRTPYHKPIEEYAAVTLTSSGEPIDTVFYFITDAVWIIHKNNGGDVRFLTSDKTGANTVSTKDGVYTYGLKQTALEQSDLDARALLYMGYKNRYELENLWNNTNAAGQPSNGEPASLSAGAVVRAYVCDKDYPQTAVPDKDTPYEQVFAWSDTIKKPMQSSGGKITFEPDTDAALSSNTAKVILTSDLLTGGADTDATFTLYINGVNAGSATYDVQQNHDFALTIGGRTVTFDARSGGGQKRSYDMRFGADFAVGETVQITVSLGGYTETSPVYTLG